MSFITTLKDPLLWSRSLPYTSHHLHIQVPRTPVSSWCTETALPPFHVAASDELFKVVDHSSVLQQILTLLCKGRSFFFATASGKGLTQTAFLKLERPELSVSNLRNARLGYSCMPRRGGFLIFLAHPQSSSVGAGQEPYFFKQWPKH